MTGSTSKKVVIRRFEREPLPGYVNPQTWLLDSAVEMISPQGMVQVVSCREIKYVCFVREFEGESGEIERRFFVSRPKGEGLWVRMRFRDGDYQDGLLANDLLQLNSLGFWIVPPDPGGNHQRLFVPRAAVTHVAVLGVVGALRKRKAGAPEEQIPLFE